MKILIPFLLLLSVMSAQPLVLVDSYPVLTASGKPGARLLFSGGETAIVAIEPGAACAFCSDKLTTAGAIPGVDVGFTSDPRPVAKLGKCAFKLVSIGHDYFCWCLPIEKCVVSGDILFSAIAPGSSFTVTEDGVTGSFTVTNPTTVRIPFVHSTECGMPARTRTFRIGTATVTVTAECTPCPFD